jgi:hypothetical protein
MFSGERRKVLEALKMILVSLSLSSCVTFVWRQGGD